MQYNLQLIAASVIAAVGFSTNSETTVIGSMLISPIGGLIIDMGKLKLTNRQIFKKTAATLVIPFLAGFIAAFCTPNEAASDAVEGRGQALIKHPRLWAAGAVVAASAGILFAWSDGETPGIGIGIATALLPPIVAAGYAAGRLIYQKDIVAARENKVTELEKNLESVEKDAEKDVNQFPNKLNLQFKLDIARSAAENTFPNGKAVGNAFAVFAVNFAILLIASLITTVGFKRLACGRIDVNTSAVPNAEVIQYTQNPMVQH